MLTFPHMKAPTYKKTYSSQPPVDFEKATGLTGISQKYKFPGGLTARQFDMCARGILPPFNQNPPEALGALKQIFNSLSALNPVAKAIPHGDDPRYLVHAIFGMASSMNIDDITFFIEQCRATNNGPVAHLTRQNPAYLSRFLPIVVGTGVYPSWVMSPATMDKAYAQIHNRRPPTTPAPRT